MLLATANNEASNSLQFRVLQFRVRATSSTNSLVRFVYVLPGTFSTTTAIGLNMAKSAYRELGEPFGHETRTSCPKNLSSPFQAPPRHDVRQVQVLRGQHLLSDLHN